MLNRFKKRLRIAQTDAEAILWLHLRNRQFLNYKFRRQHILQGYIVDFVCLEKKLIIELDGEQHYEQQQYDNKRTLSLENHGFNLIRFWNYEIFNELEDVLEVIHHALSQ